MANRDGYPERSTLPECTTLPFSFAPNLAGAVDQTTIKGKRAIKSVTRTGVGVFDCLLQDVYDDVVDVVPSIRLLTDADVTLSSWNYVPATKILTLRFRTAGAAADVAANAANLLGAVLFLRNTNLVY